MKSQAATEYLLIIGFVTFVLSAIVILAYFYTGMSKAAVRQNQLQVAMQQIIRTSESVYYSGAPSQLPVSVYFPPGIKNITIINKEIIVETETNSGVSKRVFNSRVNMTGNVDFKEGTRTIIIKALSEGVSVT